MVYDEDKAKEAGYSFTDVSKTFKVEGLAEPIEIDPFDESVFGLGVFQTLKNGDTITVTAELTNDAEQQGYVLTRTETTITVEGFDAYVTSAGQLSNLCFTQTTRFLIGRIT